MLTSFSAPYCGGMASGKPSCKGTETPTTEKEKRHHFIKGSCTGLAGMELIFFAEAYAVLSCLPELNHDSSKIQSLRPFENLRGYRTKQILSQILRSSSCAHPPGNRKTSPNAHTNNLHSSPGALGGTGGAVQAALWQRPAEICRTFFPCSTVTRVGSLTWLVWPSPS